MLIYGEVKRGDVVVCVDDVVGYGALTLGKSYTIDSIHPFKKEDTQEWILVKSDMGMWWYYPRHFSLKCDLAPVTEGWTL